MSKKLLFNLIFLLLSISASAQNWIHLASDSTDDAFNLSALDGVSLSYRYDFASDSMYFKIKVKDFIVAPFGLNIVLKVTDSTAGPSALWNSDQYSNFSFNRVLQWRTLDGTNAAVNGVANASGFSLDQYSTNVRNGVIKLRTDPADKAYILAIKRTDISVNFAAANVIAAVGTDKAWNDDIPSMEGFGTISITPNNIKEIMNSNLLSIRPNPALNSLFVQSTNSFEYVITDLTGRVIKKGTSLEYPINVSNLDPGPYIIGFTLTGDDRKFIKFLKQ